MASKKQKEKTQEIQNNLRDELEEEDDFATPPSKPWTCVEHKRTKQIARKKPKHIAENESPQLAPVNRIRLRAPPVNLSHVMKSLSAEQERAVKEMGFEHLIKFKFTEIPTQLAYRVVENLDSKRCQINTKNGSLKITKASIKSTLGIPDGKIKIENMKATKTSDTVIKEWKKQFLGIKHVYVKELVDIMMEQDDAVRLFKLNFLVLFVTVMCECISCGTVNIKFLFDCLKSTREKWNPKKHYNGPLIFLLIYYANSQSKDQSLNPSIKFWDSKKLNDVEKRELEAGEFGKSDGNAEITPYEFKKQKKKKTKGVKRKNVIIEVECSRVSKKKRSKDERDYKNATSAESVEAQIVIHETQQYDKEKSNEINNTHSQECHQQKHLTITNGIDDIRISECENNEMNEAEEQQGSDEQLKEHFPNVYVGLHTPNEVFRLDKNDCGDGSIKNNQPENLEVLETGIISRLYRIEFLKEEVEDMLKRGVAEFGKEEIIEKLRLKKQNLFNEENVEASEIPMERNVFPEKECEDVEDNTQEEEFVDDTPKNMEIDGQLSNQTIHNFEDWLSQFSMCSTVLEAIDNWNNELEETYESPLKSQKTGLFVFNNVQNFGGDEVRGKQKNKVLEQRLEDV